MVSNSEELTNLQDSIQFDEIKEDINGEDMCEKDDEKESEEEKQNLEY